MPKLAVVFLLCLSLRLRNVAQTTTGSGPEARPSRDAFTVKFDFAGKKVEQTFEATPYVEGKTASIFPGEEYRPTKGVQGACAPGTGLSREAL